MLAENDEITYEAYVSEQNLVGDDPNEPVRHPLVNEIFRGKRGIKQQNLNKMQKINSNNFNLQKSVLQLVYKK